MPPSDSGAPRRVSYWASIAASLAGCCSATVLAIQSPTPIWIGVEDRRHGQRDQHAHPVVAVAPSGRAASRPRRPTAMPNPVTMNAAIHMCANCGGIDGANIAADGVDVRQRAVRGDVEADGVVHPRVRGDDEERARDAGEDDRHGAQHVRARRQAVPAEQVDADEDRLDEEREALQHEREARRSRRRCSSGRATGCPSRRTGGCPTPRPRRTARPWPWPSVWASSCSAGSPVRCPRHSANITIAGKRDAQAGEDDVPAERDRHLHPGRDRGSPRRSASTTCRGATSTSVCPATRRGGSPPGVSTLPRRPGCGRSSSGQRTRHARHTPEALDILITGA